MIINSQRPKILIGSILLVLLLAALVFLFFTTLSREGKTRLSLDTFPSDTQVKINDQSIKSGVSYLKPGTYTLKATRDGFADYSRTLVLGDESESVVIMMNPVTDEAKKLAMDNESEYNKIQGLAERANFENGKEFHELNPIAKKLPYKTFFYSIGYRMDPSDPSGDSIIIEIDAPEGYRQSALYRIRQLGYDPTDFTINFRNYENPFPL